MRLGLQEVTIDTTSAFRGLDFFPGACLKLTISDTGKGIPPGIMDRIFVPYYTTKEPGRGTSLSLSVIHGIVKSHNGTITCTSVLHEETTLKKSFFRATFGMAVCVQFYLEAGEFIAPAFSVRSEGVFLLLNTLHQIRFLQT